MVTLRRRLEADLDACVEVLSRVKAVDGYPVHWPERPRSFVAPSYELAAWVAIDGEQVVGHVALHVGEQDPGYDLASARLGPGVPTAAVGRLFVAPGSQRSGVGSVLLRAAADAARAGGLHPFLNVVESHDKAVALYRSQGWAALGRVDLELSGDRRIPLVVFCAPGDGAP